jgi:acyl carrier protein
MTSDGNIPKQQVMLAQDNPESLQNPASRERPPLTVEYQAPQTTLQEVLVTVWARILSIQDIGVGDDFFELGGDSILATQIISQLRTMFRMDLPAIVLFDAPTIEKLAEYMTAHEVRPGLTEKTAALLKRIEGMSEEEVGRSL